MIFIFTLKLVAGCINQNCTTSTKIGSHRLQQ